MQVEHLRLEVASCMWKVVGCRLIVSGWKLIGEGWIVAGYRFKVEDFSISDWKLKLEVAGARLRVVGDFQLMFVYDFIPLVGCGEPSGAGNSTLSSCS